MTEYSKDYQNIDRVNKEINTTNIKGKEYAEVNQRINAFRKLHPLGSILTEIISMENGVVVVKAIVSTEDGKVLGTGLAFEKEGSTFINKTSYLENCETSAVGRALGMCGYGIETGVASKEEVENAIANQDKTKGEPKTSEASKNNGMPAPKATLAQIKEVQKKYTKEIIDATLKKYNVTEIGALPFEVVEKMIEHNNEIKTN